MKFAQQAVEAAREDPHVYMNLQRPDLTDTQGQHHIELVRKFNEAEARENVRQIWVLPPGSGKTTTLELLVSWYIGKHPDHRVIYACYNLELATDSGRRIRDYVNNDIHQQVFPGCKLAQDSKSIQRLFTSKRGMFIAAGVRGTITGRRANLFVIDDPIKDREMALSDLDRKKRQEWIKWVVETRTVPGCVILLQNTRWHEDDVAGWLMRKLGVKGAKTSDGLDGMYDYVHFASIAEQDEGWRNEGDPLWPQAGYTKEWLLEKQRTMGLQEFNCVHQGRPSSIEGNMFKRIWLESGPDGRSRLIDPVDWGEMNRYILVDPAGSKSKQSDYTAMIVVGLSSDENYYILDIVRDKLSLTERIKKLFDLQKKYRPLAIGYEEYAFQSDIQAIRMEMERINYRNMNIVPLGGKGKRTSKYGRIEPLQSLFQTGRIYLLKHYFYTDYMGQERDLALDFVEDEYVVYPVPRGHDDMLDALSRIVDPMFSTTFPMTYDDESLYEDTKPTSWLSA